jgi:hypothetical protein
MLQVSAINLRGLPMAVTFLAGRCQIGFSRWNRGSRLKINVTHFAFIFKGLCIDWTGEMRLVRRPEVWLAQRPTSVPRLHTQRFQPSSLCLSHCH